MISLVNSKYFVATSQFVAPFLVLVTSVTALYFMYFSHYFQLKKIECFQDVGETCQNGHLMAEHNQLVGNNLLRLDLESMRERILRADPTIRQLQYKKILPNTLVINIQSVYPTIALGVSGSEELLVLDNEYRLIKKTMTFPNVPIVSLKDKSITLAVGNTLSDDTLRTILNTCLALASNLTSSTLYEVTNNDITVSLEDSGTKAMFTTLRPIEDQLSALHAIRSDATILNKGSLIDLRYHQPIIKSDN